MIKNKKTSISDNGDTVTTYDINLSEGLQTLLEEESKKFDNIQAKEIQISDEKREILNKAKLEYQQNKKITGLNIVSGKNNDVKKSLFVKNKNGDLVKVDRKEAPRKSGAIKLSDLFK